MLQFWLAHLVVVPAAFLIAFFGPILLQAFAAPDDARFETLGLMIAFGYVIGGYALGAAVTAIHAFGLYGWQSLRGSVSLVAIVLAPMILCSALLLVAGLPAIASGDGTALLPGGRDFGVTLVFVVTALAFIGTFFICRWLGLVEAAHG